MDVPEELLRRLTDAAERAARRAHAPYSRFRVGAAVYTDRERIVTGCNVENASYGLTMCAERVAIGRVVAEDAGKPLICAVTGPTDQPLTPCGACRQVLLEFNPDMVVVCTGRSGRRLVLRAGELLPASFGKGALGVD